MRAARDEEFDLILRRFSNAIRAQVRSQGVERMGIDPEDVIQEIRVRLWKSLAGEKKVANLASYIKKVVTSVLIDEVRKARTQDRVVFRAVQEKLEEGRPRAESPAPGEFPGPLVEEAVAMLIESRRQVVRLFLLGLSVEEISSALGWSQDKARNLLYRGLADLKNTLKKKGVEYED